MAQLVINDVGTTIRVRVRSGDGTVFNLSTATITKELTFTLPDLSTVTKAGTFVTDGTDGKIKYVTEAGFLTLAGIWKVRGHFVGAGFDRKTDQAAFDVIA